MRNAIFAALMSPIHTSTQFRQKQIRDVEYIPKTLKTYQQNHHLRLRPHRRIWRVRICITNFKKYPRCNAYRLATLTVIMHMTVVVPYGQQKTKDESNDSRLSAWLSHSEAQYHDSFPLRAVQDTDDSSTSTVGPTESGGTLLLLSLKKCFLFLAFSSGLIHINDEQIK